MKATSACIGQKKKAMRKSNMRHLTCRSGCCLGRTAGALVRH